jgi:hypothetical protein
VMAALVKLLGRELSDEAAAADEEGFHDCFSGAKAPGLLLTVRLKSYPVTRGSWPICEGDKTARINAYLILLLPH